MTRSGTPSHRSSFLCFVACVWNVSLLAGCDRAPREPTGPEPEATPVEENPQQEPVPEPQNPPPSGTQDACVVPLEDPPPPEVASVNDCPPDPDGRPEMPWGTVTFPDAEKAPELRVEMALNDGHRGHGLMFRPTLSDDEGMLFSWQDERQRFFWMKNTCLALDMLFIAQDGTIAGILENVPPMNTRPQRTVPCPAAHVLEVRAGWTRTYGVKPGQKMQVTPAEN